MQIKRKKHLMLKIMSVKKKIEINSHNLLICCFYNTIIKMIRKDEIMSY